MAADFIIYPEHKAVFSYGWGTLTFADIQDHRDRLFRDARYTADFNQIINLLDVAEIALSSDQISALAKEPVFAGRSRRALVASDALNFGLSRMFLAYSEAQTINIFQRLDEAAAWLELPVDIAIKAFNEIRQAHRLA